MSRLFNWIIRKISKNGKRVVLFVCSIDLDKYHRVKEGSCEIDAHPMIVGDEIVTEKIKDLGRYIRDRYDMDDFLDIDKWGQHGEY